MPSNAFARPAFGPALAVTVFSSLAPPLFAADTQLQTVTVQASSCLLYTSPSPRDS